MPYGSVGGMERLAFTFYQFYKNQGHVVKAVKIIGLENDIISFGEDEYVLSKKDLWEIPSGKRLLFYAKGPGLLRKIIKKEKITHSIAFGDMANMYSSLTRTNEFKIASIHSLKSMELFHPTGMNKLFRLGYRTTYKAFGKVVCISEEIRKDLVENCGFRFPEKLQVLYNPHDITGVRKMAGVALDDTSEEALFTKNTIVFLGRLSVEKALWHMVNAFRILSDRHPEANLVFIGDGDAQVMTYLEKQISGHGLSDKITFLGRKSNPYRYISRAKLLAMTSYFEGVPNVIIEAMALGIPTVTSLSTKGLFEIMSLQKPVEKDQMVFTEAGIITPSFFKGQMAIPEESPLIAEEKIYASALEQVLESEHFSRSIKENEVALLKKFDIQPVAEGYLQTI